MRQKGKRWEVTGSEDAEGCWDVREGKRQKEGTGYNRKGDVNIG